MTQRPSWKLMAAAILAYGLPAAALAQTQTFTVDCGKGQTISAALERGDSRKPLVLIVRGICNENVTISRDDVTLQGDPASGGTINGPSSGSAVYLAGAHRVLIDRLSIRGGTTAISVFGGSNVAISNSDVQYASSQGIGVIGASAVNVTNCSVQNNARSGIGMEQASVTITNSQISLNSGNGVRADRNSSVVVSGSTINSNAFSGVTLVKSEAGIGGTTITANGTNASQASRHGINATSSNVTMNNTTIQGNMGHGVLAVLGGSVSVGSGSVTGNTGNGVFLYMDVTGNFFGNTQISNNLGSADLVLMINATGQLADGNLTIPNIQASQASNLWVNPVSGPPINGSVQCFDGKTSINSSTRFTGPVLCGGY